jgi:hypothetical protein
MNVTFHATCTRYGSFLREHPQLDAARASSSVWPMLRDNAALMLFGKPVFVVAGDTLGDENDLYLNELARGAADRDESSLSRALFMELSPDLRAVVIHNLLEKR